MSGDEIVARYDEMRARVDRVAQDALAKPRLETVADVMASIEPEVGAKLSPPMADTAVRDALFVKDVRNLAKPVTLAKSINFALADLMLQYPNISLFGEDVARKGGVYGVTQGLQDKFGAARVFDTLLDEQTILGLAIGMGHNGFVPIPEIQFLAYLHNAEDQLRGEAATLSFFSNKQYRNPMVVRIAGLPYQKGFGGHFHNDNSLAVLTDIPGIIVAVPSCAADAPAMLRECARLAHEDGRVVVFVEPIALYHTSRPVGGGGWRCGPRLMLRPDKADGNCLWRTWSTWYWNSTCNHNLRQWLFSFTPSRSRIAQCWYRPAHHRPALAAPAE